MGKGRLKLKIKWVPHAEHVEFLDAPNIDRKAFAEVLTKKLQSAGVLRPGKKISRPLATLWITKRAVPPTKYIKFIQLILLRTVLTYRKPYERKRRTPQTTQILAQKRG